MEHDIEKIRTEMADLAVELTNGIEGPRLSYYLQVLGKDRFSDNGWHETSEFLEVCESAKRMALQKVWGRNRDLKSEVLDYFNVTTCDVNVTTLCQHMTIVTKQEKTRLRQVLSRLVNDDKVLINDKRGFYRLKKKIEFKDWTKAVSKPVSLFLPCELSSPGFSVLTPGDIVLFMGSPNSGKTAALLETAKENRKNWNVYYFSSEITAASFNDRLSKFKDCSVDQMSKIKFNDEMEAGDDFSDIIIPGEGNLNIIDYLEVYEKMWEIGGMIDRIHKKLKGAMCVCAIQKDPTKEVGYGGTFTQMKPMLSVSLDYGYIATITKMKQWNKKIQNPNHKIYRFKLDDACQFRRATPSVGWTTKQAGGVDHGI